MATSGPLAAGFALLWQVHPPIACLCHVEVWQHALGAEHLNALSS